MQKQPDTAEQIDILQNSVRELSSVLQELLEGLEKGRAAEISVVSLSKFQLRNLSTRLKKIDANF